MKLSPALLYSIAAGAVVLTTSCEQQPSAPLPDKTVRLFDSAPPAKGLTDSFPGPVPVDTAKMKPRICYACGMG